jgi:hypothetical protein
VFAQSDAAKPKEFSGDAGSKRLVLTSASLGFVVVQLDVTIVNVALQQIGGSFGGMSPACSGL